jgi:hypothetical protein
MKYGELAAATGIDKAKVKKTLKKKRKSLHLKYVFT